MDFVVVFFTGFVFFLAVSMKALSFVEKRSRVALPGDALIRKKDGKLIKVFEKKELILPWEIKGYELYHPHFPNIELTSSRRVITVKTGLFVSNPLVSLLMFYTFSVSGNSKADNYLKKELYDLVKQDGGLHDFDFFDPTDPTQQKKFMVLISDYLNPKLAPIGLEVKETSFSLV